MRTPVWDKTMHPLKWLIALAVTVLSACATMEIPKEQDYPAGWPAIVSPGSECRGIEGTYDNEGTGARADASGVRRATWFTDLFQTYGVWFIGRSGFPGYERVRYDLHACDQVTIRIESIPSSEGSFRSNPSTITMLIDASRPLSRESSTERMPCMTLAVPSAGGRSYAFPPHDGYLFCRATNVFYAGGNPGSWSGFDLYLARAADGSLVAFRRELLETGSWARFLKRSE